jgi:hypothetical protein
MVADGGGCPRECEIIGAGLGDFDGVRRARPAVDLCAVPPGFTDVDGDDGGGQRRAEVVARDHEEPVLGVRLQAAHGEQCGGCVDVLNGEKNCYDIGWP